MATQDIAENESGAQPSGIRLPQLPVRELGLAYVPAVPVDSARMVDTLVRLGVKVKQREQALQGLSKTFTIGRSTARACAFLFGREAADTKAAAGHERLRGFLDRNPMAILPSLVEKLKQQDDELVRGRGGRRR
jgi:hypothetical protein